MVIKKKFLSLKLKMNQDKPRILICGGTGFDSIDGLSSEMKSYDTPFNSLINPRLDGLTYNPEEHCKKHSPDIAILEQKRAVAIFLARHGAGHRNSASDTNHLANMYGAWINCRAEYGIGITAVGSLRKDVPVGSLVVFEWIDRVDPAPYLTNPYLGVDTIHVGTHGQECHPIIRQLLREELKPVEGSFAGLNVPESQRPKVHYGSSLALINKDDFFSTPAESANLRVRNEGKNVCVGMTAYEVFSSLLLSGGLFGLVGLVVDMDNTLPEQGVDQSVVSKNIEGFRPLVAELVERIIARGAYIDPRIGLLPLKKGILSPASPTAALRERSRELAELVERARALDENSLVYPEWYR